MAQTNAKTGLSLEPQIEIDALSYGPYGIGRIDGKAVMIPDTAPGDTVVARITENKERYAIGVVERLIRPSPLRQTPPCPYVGRCGGCSWQHIQYDAQLKAKQQSVADALRRIGKLTDFELKPIIRSADSQHYRRRIRLQVHGSRLGFYGAASHDLVEIDACVIAAQPLNAVLEPVRRWFGNLTTTIDHVELATGDEPDETVIVARAADRFIPRDRPACEELLISAAKSIRGVVLIGPDWRETWGQTSLTVRLSGDLSLKLDADVFTQVNSEGNQRMLNELLAAGNFHRGDHVLELYCGAGNFTLPVAKRVEEIVAVEGDRRAVAGGKLNAQRNALENIRWISSSVPQAVAHLKRQKTSFNKIILDPPRTGAKGIESDLAALGAEMICYISCNPATLGRDLAALSKTGYKLSFVQPIDFFPQTFHVESLSILTR
jgi:23S rRNA (uracil1939-C5)-methyltransferase